MLVIALFLDPLAAYSISDTKQPIQTTRATTTPLSLSDSLPINIMLPTYEPYQQEQQQLESNFNASIAAMQDENPTPLVKVDSVILDSIRDAANEFNVPVELLFDQTAQESEFNIHETGSSGEIGMLQIMPDTAKQINNNVFKIANFKPSMLYDPKLNARFAACFLAYLRTQTDNWEDALTAYNMGEGGLHHFKKTFGNEKHSDYFVAIEKKHEILFNKPINV